MKSDDTRRENYSAHVRLWLERGTKIVRLAQVAPESVMMAEPSEMSPGEVTVVMQIDGVNHPRHMYLPNGIISADRWVEIVELGEVQV